MGYHVEEEYIWSLNSLALCKELGTKVMEVLGGNIVQKKTQYTNPIATELGSLFIVVGS